MVVTTNTSYIVSSKDRSKTELVIADADMRAARQGDSAAREQITHAYDTQSTYLPTTTCSPRLESHHRLHGAI